MKTLPVFLFVLFLITACTPPDPCEDVTCLNGGICNNGGCDCPTWYEGSDCGSAFRSRFLGKYVGVLTAENFATKITGTVNHNILTYGSAPNVLTLDGSIIIEFIDTYGNFRVWSQKVNDLNITSGSGSFSGNKLSYFYGGRSISGGETQTFTFIGYR